MRVCLFVLVAVGCSGDRAPAPAPAVAAVAAAAARDAAVDAAAAAMPPAVLAPPIGVHGRIAVGTWRACARTAAGELACWDSGRYDAADLPAVVAGVDRVAGVAQGGACAWTATGAVWCVDGDGKARRVPGITDAVEVASDTYAAWACARRAAGAVACWGGSDAPAEVPGATAAVELAVAGDDACLRDAAGVACWSMSGSARAPQRIAAANGATAIAGGAGRFVALRGERPAVAWLADRRPVELPALGRGVVQVALGDHEGCALGSAVRCWDFDHPEALVAIQGVAGAREVAASRDLSCADLGDRIACWGEVDRLGNGTRTVVDTPVDVAGVTDAVKLEADGVEACARRATGADVCWGVGMPVPVPASAEAMRSFRAPLPAGVTRSWQGFDNRTGWACAERAGHVACDETFVGRHGEDDSTFPATGMGDLDGIRDMRLPTNGTSIMCIADAAGAVTCFEAGDRPANAAPVPGLADVVQLAALGLEDTCALTRAGKVTCWNERERVYQGAALRPIPRIDDGVELVSTGDVACVRRHSGTVSCWGYRPALGDGADVHHTAAVTVPGIAL